MLRLPCSISPTGFAHNFVSVDRILLRSDGSAVLVDYRWPHLWKMHKYRVMAPLFVERKS